MVKKMSSHLLVDIGSSSVKFYLLQVSKLSLLSVKSIPLKTGFTQETGLSKENKDLLFTLIKEIKAKHKNVILHLYATALFRKMSPIMQKKTIEEFFKEFNSQLSILTHDEENTFLELAVAGKYHSESPVLIMNIGGGSTELVILKNSIAVERYNVDLGVGTIMTSYPSMNDDVKDLSIETVKDFILPHLPMIKASPLEVAFVTGGELTYMKSAGYKLTKNTLFEDRDHPFLITVQDQVARNGEIFTRVSMKELESLMPDNPTWMHGTRAFLVIADTICEKYHVRRIVPSDANLINGIVRAHFNL